MSVNKVILVGRLGQDPEVRYTPSGVAVCNFSLATSENWKDRNSGQKQEKTEWHRVVVWNKTAELCKQYLSKGRQVYLEGKLQTRAWDDKSGQKRYTTEILANTVQFLGETKGGQNFGDAPSMDDQNLPNSGRNNSQDGGNDFSSVNLNMDDSFTADDIPF